DPAPGTVLLRQELAGCCATDAHTYLGQWPADFPVILGHENVGIIEAIGSGGALDFLGREVRVGDRVIARTGCCGTCYEFRAVHRFRSAVWPTSPDAVVTCGCGMASPGRKMRRSAVVTASISISARRRRPLCSRLTRVLPLPRCTSRWGWRRMPCAARNPSSGDQG